MDADPRSTGEGGGRRVTDAAHDRRVGAVAETVRALVGARGPVHIDKGGVHHVVPLASGDSRFTGRRIDVSTLRHVLEVDVERRLCVAEPGVTFRAVVDATLRHGLVPAVVPELEGITLGGAVAGCSVESSSFRYGGFHDSCLDYEVVTGTGEVLGCSPEHEPLVFGMIHGSYGTLAILTRVRFALVAAKPYVHVEYRRFRDPASLHAAMLARCEAADVDFIDGIVHAPDHWTLCLGRFVERARRASSYRWLDVYYKSTRVLDEDVLTTPDYFFRYDTEAHWLSRTVPPLEWKPVRFLLGRLFLGSTNMIRWSGRLRPIFRLKRRPDVVCDYFIPAGRVPEFYDWYLRELRYFPLWVVPYRVPKPYPWLSAGHRARAGDLYVDLAVYGMPNGDPGVDRSEQLEEKTYELGGLKTLISRNHYSAERFWSIYDEATVRQVKARLDPRGMFRDLYEKLHRVG
ncbi:MAG TPA: FAD-binding oxidoreductase [Candidatus Binatus sp.]|jgi:FAD/FMN-containing dehydrogenase|nr:FAD-binding oxidoreductase [Candidatus Binatus sp.]